MRLALVLVALAAALALPASAGSADGEYCCADDQNVAASFSTEFNLLTVQWGWPEGDPRELPACGVLGGEVVMPNGRIDTSRPNAFDTALDPCLRGKGTHYERPDVGLTPYYVQVRFLCNARYPCGGAQFVLSRAVRVSVGGLPPPACHVPRVIGMRLAQARARIRRGGCTVGSVRRVGSRRVGRVLDQRPSAGSRRRYHFPVRLVVGRRRA